MADTATEQWLLERRFREEPATAEDYLRDEIRRLQHIAKYQRNTASRYRQQAEESEAYAAEIEAAVLDLQGKLALNPLLDAAEAGRRPGG